MNLPGKNKKIKNLIFGGTFDPIHYGHIEIVKKINLNFSPEKIYVVPSGNPYMKPKPPVATPLQRLEMCKLAFNDFNSVKIIDYEIFLINMIQKYFNFRKSTLFKKYDRRK